MSRNLKLVWMEIKTDGLAVCCPYNNQVSTGESFLRPLIYLVHQAFHLQTAAAAAATQNKPNYTLLSLFFFFVFPPRTRSCATGRRMGRRKWREIREIVGGWLPDWLVRKTSKASAGQSKVCPPWHILRNIVYYQYIYYIYIYIFDWFCLAALWTIFPGSLANLKSQ